jgi:hypothetical protein
VEVEVEVEAASLFQIQTLQRYLQRYKLYEPHMTQLLLLAAAEGVVAVAVVPHLSLIQHA